MLPTSITPFAGVHAHVARIPLGQAVSLRAQWPTTWRAQPACHRSRCCIIAVALRRQGPPASHVQSSSWPLTASNRDSPCRPASSGSRVTYRPPQGHMGREAKQASSSERIWVSFRARIQPISASCPDASTPSASRESRPDSPQLAQARPPFAPIRVLQPLQTGNRLVEDESA